LKKSKWNILNPRDYPSDTRAITPFMEFIIKGNKISFKPRKGKELDIFQKLMRVFSFARNILVFFSFQITQVLTNQIKCIKRASGFNETWRNTELKIMIRDG